MEVVKLVSQKRERSRVVEHAVDVLGPRDVRRGFCFCLKMHDPVTTKIL